MLRVSLTFMHYHELRQLNCSFCAHYDKITIKGGTYIGVQPLPNVWLSLIYILV